MLVIKNGQIDEIIAHSNSGLPNESCGLLGGIIDGGKKIIQKVYLLKNTDNSPEHFSMEPEEQFKVISDIRKNEWQLIGNFHSHPESPSKPSDEDIKLAFDPSLSYLILSLQEKLNPVLNSFIIKDKTVSREEITILE
jgi:[CysO sulfur-carrier protein]-S-L-cysteine hydrolase